MLVPWKKSYDKPRKHIKKQRQHFATKVHIVKAMLSSSCHVHMRELDHKEDWAQKNWIFFKLQCWRRLLRVLWTARISNQSILKEIKPEYSLKDWDWSSNTLVIWCEEVTLEKTLMLGKIGGRRRRGRQRMRQLDAITESQTWAWANSGR